MNILIRPVRSSLGSKYVMAVTGALLMGFILAHMAGNLLIYAGPDAINSYAQALKKNPALLWTARTGLFLLFTFHIVLGIWLSRQNQIARPNRYVYEDTKKASWASRHMMLTGLLLLTFVLYHLAHFTFGIVKSADVYDLRTGKNVVLPYLELEEIHDPIQEKYVPRYSRVGQQEPLLSLENQKHRHDVYRMVVTSFLNPWISLSYILFMVALWLHLWHGGSSWFQSLGINNPRLRRLTSLFGPVFATLVLLGNCSIPLSILLGLIR